MEAEAEAEAANFSKLEAEAEAEAMKKLPLPDTLGPSQECARGSRLSWRQCDQTHLTVTVYSVIVYTVRTLLQCNKNTL